MNPKIKAYVIDGQVNFEWDHTDQELIDAGINDMTPEEWGDVAQYVEDQIAANPIVEIRDGQPWIAEPGKDFKPMDPDDPRQEFVPRG